MCCGMEGRPFSQAANLVVLHEGHILRVGIGACMVGSMASSDRRGQICVLHKEDLLICNADAAA